MGFNKKYNIKYFSTTRFEKKGSSNGNYKNFNLAIHTGDDKNNVLQNRALLIKEYNLPSCPKWLEQSHSNICIDDDDTTQADAIITRKPNIVCCIMTADCLPIFAWHTDKHNHNTIVGVAHAGWQGVFNGIIKNFINKFNIDSKMINVALGTSLRQDSFEVDVDFYNKFITKNSQFKSCFINFNNKYKFDIYKAATIILHNLGVINIQTNKGDTFTDSHLFSYRRDGENSGRQAHIIWFE